MTVPGVGDRHAKATMNHEGGGGNMLPGSKSTTGAFGVVDGVGSLLTVLLPGSFGIGFWTILVMSKGAPLIDQDVLKHVESLGRLGWGVVLIASAMFAGAVFHVAGTQIEAQIFDTAMDKRRKNRHLAEWFEYLRTTFDVEPVGHRYLRTMVQKLFFELHMVPALLSSATGLAVCKFTGVLSLDGTTLMEGVLLHALAAVWLLFAAFDAHAVLSRVRHEILRGVGEPSTLRDTPRPGEVSDAEFRLGAWAKVTQWVLLMLFTLVALGTAYANALWGWFTGWFVILVSGLGWLGWRRVVAPTGAGTGKA